MSMIMRTGKPKLESKSDKEFITNYKAWKRKLQGELSYELLSLSPKAQRDYIKGLDSFKKYNDVFMVCLELENDQKFKESWHEKFLEDNKNKLDCPLSQYDCLKKYTPADSQNFVLTDRFPKNFSDEFIRKYYSGMRQWASEKSKIIWAERYDQKSDKEVFSDIINGRYAE